MLLIIKLSLRDYCCICSSQAVFFIIIVRPIHQSNFLLSNKTLNVWSSWRFRFLTQALVPSIKYHLPSSPSFHRRLMGSPEFTLWSSWWKCLDLRTWTIKTTQTKRTIVWKNSNRNEKCQRISEIKGKNPIGMDT